MQVFDLSNQKFKTVLKHKKNDTFTNLKETLKEKQTILRLQKLLAAQINDNKQLKINVKGLEKENISLR